MVGVTATGVAATDSGTPDVGVDESAGEVEFVVFTEEDSWENSLESQPAGSFEAYARETDGVTVMETFDAVGAVLVTVDVSQVDSEDLERVDGVDRVSQNEQLDVPDADPEPVAEDRLEPAAHGDAVWGVDRVGAPEVWRNDTRGDGVRLAVLDTGVDTEHPDVGLADDGWAEFDRSGDRIQSEPYDDHGHGTQVSSIAAGGNDSGPHVGVAPEAELLVGGVFTPEGQTTAALLAGIDWAIQNDADVLSISIGNLGHHDEFVEPVRRAQRQGVVVVSAVGNDGEGLSRSPANVYESLAVGATTASGDIRVDSGGEVIETEEAWVDPPANWPDQYVVPDLVAPGDDLRAADNGGGYARVEQTSMAAPHAAGAAALLRSVDPSLTPAETDWLLTRSAADVESAPDGPDPRYGHGLLDVDAAVGLLDDLEKLEGTVTDETGSPVAGATVFADRLETKTDENGTYSVRVPEGATTVQVDGFGIAPEAANVTVDENGTKHDIAVETEPAVEVTSSTPETVAPGTSVDLRFRIAGIEQYTPGIEDGSVANVTLEDFQLGSTHDLDNAERGDVVSVTVETAPEQVGSLGLTHGFETADGQTIEERTSMTVLADPITVGTNGTVASINDALDLAVDGSTIELLENRYEHQNGSPLTIEDSVRITAAEGAQPAVTGLGSDQRGDAGLAIQADDVVLADVSVNATDADIGVHVGDGTGLVVTNASIRGGSIGLGIETAAERVVDTDVAAAQRGVVVSDELGEFVGNELSSAGTDLVVERNGQIGSAAENAFVGENVGIALEDGIVGSIEANRFEGAVGIEVTSGGALSTDNDYSGVEDVALRAANGTIHSEFDFFGSEGPSADDLQGAVAVELFLTAPPADVEEAHNDLQHFGYQLELEAGEPTAVAFPAPLANDLETTFGEFDGNVYEYENDRWKPVNQPHRTPEALEAFVVVPEEDATVFVEFEAVDDATVAPGEHDLDSGWNLVGAPMAGEPDEAFAASSAVPARALNPFAAPKGSLLPTGDDDWLAYTIGSDADGPVLDPHAGYFVYATEDGGLGASAYSGATVGEIKELLVPGAAAGTLEPDAVDDASVVTATTTNARVTG